jgi:hypothetical protein
MANESTYTGISGVVNPIYEVAFLTAREQSIMPALVSVFNDSTSSTPRIWNSYSGGTIATVTEATDMSSQAFTHAAAGTLTPAQYGAQYFLTDQRIASDWANASLDAGTDLGQLLAVHVDTNLCGTAVFKAFTGGTVGTAGGTLTWTNIMRANAYLKAAHAPFPYSVVLRPEHWYYLASVASGVPTLAVSNELMDSIAREFYVGSWGGMDFFVDANITSGTAAYAGMFSRQGIALDIRRAFRLEGERDASRGGGGYELNATMIYAYGLYRPTFGVGMIGTSA